MPADIYQLKVTLLGTKPPIWRLLLAPATVSLDELHLLLQVAMGWENCHLFRFPAGRYEFDPSENEELALVGPPLREMLRRVGAKAIYEYDFGDCRSRKPHL
ncbi:MAG: plasmid pRiA4b ORF-3 family protein, partial [Acidobacteria bacterium]|nr:plasmid pRiA4b ORF-3 family protein [Acidobacteriota bacterium]